MLRADSWQNIAYNYRLLADLADRCDAPCTEEEYKKRVEAFNTALAKYTATMRTIVQTQSPS